MAYLAQIDPDSGLFRECWESSGNGLSIQYPESRGE